MLGLIVDKKPLLRAYSIVSANYSEELEFFSIKVPDGPLTSKLQKIQVGDELLVSKKTDGNIGSRSFIAGKNFVSVSYRHWVGAIFKHRSRSKPI
jgi:ferredoxin--NADP+ reductase